MKRVNATKIERNRLIKECQKNGIKTDRGSMTCKQQIIYMNKLLSTR